jgi:succinate dehydrogenase / fumarate reductase, cytochrome b subunit
MNLPGNPESRPLSPHLQVYRPMYTMVLSILHRASGMLLSVGSVLMVAWLACIAAGASVYQSAGACLSSLPARLLIAGVLAAFWYHLFAGLRHLSWDAGFGFGRRGARVGGALIVLLAALAFLATLFWTSAGRWLGVIA